jgi:hypothetical protein
MQGRFTTNTFRGAVWLAASCIAFHAGATTFTVTPSGFSAWNINTDGAGDVPNADITLVTGQTYTFNVSGSGTHPFYIKTVQGTGSANAYPTGGSSGLSANGITTTSTITFTPPDNVQTTLFYNCFNHALMTGTITIIVDPIFSDNFGNG